MIKKILKLLMIFFMVLGTVFAISNLIPKKINADALRGLEWTWPDGSKDCIRIGNQCDLLFSAFEADSVPTTKSNEVDSKRYSNMVEKDKKKQKNELISRGK